MIEGFNDSICFAQCHVSFPGFWLSEVSMLKEKNMIMSLHSVLQVLDLHYSPW